jgi:GNAT superfamily N-acetyltransferase
MPIEFDIADSAFIVRPAKPLDEKACRMLLPELAGAEAHRFVAIDGKHGLAVGAAAATFAQRTEPIPGPGVAVHVIEPCRRHGIGQSLVAALTSLARSQGAAALYAAQRVEFDSQPMHAWQRLGFEVCETVEEHELPIEPVLARLAPLVAELHRRGSIPENARVVPLHAANRAKVLQLHLDELGGDRGPLYQRLLGHGAGAFHQRYSKVLLVGEKAAGCLLAHRQSEHVATLDANILAPEFRSTWANAWLRHEAIQDAAALGITRFHFTSFDKYADTRAFTEKLGGATTHRRALMYRRLD